MTSCRTCAENVQDNELFCPTCWDFHGYPNVKKAFGERAELEARYLALDEAIRNDTVLRDVASKTDAVVNVGLDYVHSFLNSDRALYTPYRKQVEAQTRRPASPDNDEQRFATEGELFGSAASVLYAALAGPAQGLSSYGPVALRLKEDVVRKRASLLEENSYAFCNRFRRPLPKGHRATWDDRVMLAMTKLVDTTTRTAAALRQALLFSEGNRDTDCFIEIHIWGGLTHNSVDSLELQRKPLPGDETLLAQLAENAAKRRRIRWEAV